MTLEVKGWLFAIVGEQKSARQVIEPGEIASNDFVVPNLCS
jgi:hypothetical protein